VDCFESATERDIYTGRIKIYCLILKDNKCMLLIGDKLEVVILRKNQEPQVSYFNLRRDWENCS